MKDNNWILIVDDDADLANLVADFLEMNGYKTEIEHNGAKAVERIIAEQPILVILDVMLPDMDGLSICRAVRHGHPGIEGSYNGPILMLTALNNDIDEVAGLETGADDYLAKPVRSRVLLARVRALLRRKPEPPVTEKLSKLHSNNDSLIEFDGLSIDKKYQRIQQHGQDIELTTAEFELLWLLASRPGEICDRDSISDYFSDLGYESSHRTIDLRVSRIRRKLGDDPSHATRIKTIHGKGYLFVGD
ncbi:response regulator transcription factor [Shewanella sp. KCT]|uniref:response regulator transcription factor n=1 Tax=Shewanella sp. KCT TaxID=2569535 RepID=UPI001181CB43|nr:response regulator transcription factor [Shewanella sp. KCT]TVP12757.1 DNA-binding response regulator [Shewanella sp. KCT]